LGRNDAIWAVKSPVPALTAAQRVNQSVARFAKASAGEAQVVSGAVVVVLASVMAVVDGVMVGGAVVVAVVVGVVAAVVFEVCPPPKSQPARAGRATSRAIPNNAQVDLTAMMTPDQSASLFAPLYPLG
jgi:hypothetical protein